MGEIEVTGGETSLTQGKGGDMSIRLGEHVVCGELFNTSNYGTHGYVVLRRAEDDVEEDDMVLRFELTGDCAADLKGKHIRFEPAEDDGTQIPFSRDNYKKMQNFQHGPTGMMTAQGWVRALPCTVEEFVQRSSLGEPPPTEWRNHLMLEWFGPNGRVTVEMAGPTVEYCTREPVFTGLDEEEENQDEGDWAPLLNLAMPPDMDRPSAGPSVTRLERRGQDIHVEEMRPMPPEALSPEDGDDFQQMLDAEAEAIDRAIGGGSDETEEALMRMDYCMERGERKSFDTFLGDLNKLPRPENLDDTAVEAVLKALLARLVTVGVVLDVCDHFTPRDCYVLLLDEIFKEEGAYEELVGTGWTQHFSTWEYCAGCKEEMDAKYGSGDF